MTNMNDVVHIADYVSAQSDRWLFIATLILLILGVIWAARYMVKMLENQMSKVEAANKAFADSQQKTIGDLAIVLMRNTEALEGCKDALDRQVQMQSSCIHTQEEFRRIADKMHV